MHSSLVPANTKKSVLILGMFRPVDLIVLGVGTVITILLLLIFETANTWIMLLLCLPMLISAFLVLPIPNYHNTLCALQSILEYYNGRKKFIWKGWCMKNEFQSNK